MNALLIRLACILLLGWIPAVSAYGETAALPIPIFKHKRTSPVTNEEILDYSTGKVALGVNKAKFEPPIELSAPDLEPWFVSCRDLLITVLNNNRADFGLLCYNDDAADNMFQRLREKIDTSIYSLEHLPRVVLVTEFLGIKYLSFEDNAVFGLIFVNRGGGYKLWGLPEIPPLNALISHFFWARRDPVAAAPVSVDGFKSVEIERNFNPDESQPNYNKVYFKGFIPEWGRRVFRNGSLVTDPSEQAHVTDPHYSLIRFIRDTWHTYANLPELATEGTEPVPTALLDRSSELMREQIQYFWSIQVTQGSTAARLPFRQRYKEITLLYIIDADPFFLSIWTPLKLNPDDEMYKSHGFSGQPPFGFEGTLGVDLYQREHDTYMLCDMHLIESTSICQLFSWPPVQESLSKLIADEYATAFGQAK